MSAIGCIVGAVFVGIGVFVAIPGAGGFGVLWTLVAIAITGYHALNLFTEHGVAQEVVEFDTPPRPKPTPARTETPEERLTRMTALREKGLISEQEYEQQRKRILDEI